MTRPQDVNAEIEELVLGQAVDREAFLEHVRLELVPAVDFLVKARTNIAAFLIKHPIPRVLEANEHLDRAGRSLKGYVDIQLGKKREGRVLGKLEFKTFEDLFDATKEADFTFDMREGFFAKYEGIWPHGLTREFMFDPIRNEAYQEERRKLGDDFTIHITDSERLMELANQFLKSIGEKPLGREPLV